MTATDNGKEILLEQYKLYVEMADRVSARRIDANRFYSALMTGLLALIPIVLSQNQLRQFTTAILVSISILGMFLSFLWMVNITSYKQLNSLKFRVIHEMEKQLPFACYEREWEVLKEDGSKKRYLRLSTVEKYVPAAFSISYLVIFVFALFYGP